MFYQKEKNKHKFITISIQAKRGIFQVDSNYRIYQGLSTGTICVQHKHCLSANHYNASFYPHREMHSPLSYQMVWKLMFVNFYTFFNT